MGFGNANIYFKVSVGLSLLALITHVIGFATPEWIVLEGVLLPVRLTAGLWNICENGECESYSLAPAGSIPGKLKVERAMGTIGLILVLASAVGTALAAFVDSFRSKANLVGVCALLACITIIICVILMGTDIDSPGKAGYSLGLSVVGGILSLATAGLLFFGHHKM